MTIRDLKNNVDAAFSLAPAARVNGTANGTVVDLRGYDAAMLLVQFGAYTDGTHTPSLEHSDDGSSFAAVPAVELSNTLTAVGSGGANSTQRAGYQGSKRYLRAVMVVTGATTGALSAALVLRGAPRQAPV